MSELQDALKRIPEDWNGSATWREPVLVLREAARLVADPNIEAATRVAKHRMPFIDWSTADAVIRELIAAALTPLGDTQQ